MSEHVEEHQPPRAVSEGPELPHGITMTEIRAQVASARRRVIEPKLGTEYASRFADEVESIVLEQAWIHVRDGVYDPDRAPLAYWVLRIADLRTRDQIKKITRGRGWRSEKLFAEHPEKSTTEQMEEALHRSHRGTEPDHAALYAEVEADKVWLHPILVACGQVMDHRKFLRAYFVYFRFDGSVNVAAEHLAQDPAHLRVCVRDFRTHLKVIHHAQQAHWAGATGTLNEVIDCLPEEDEAGGHRRRIAEAAKAWAERGNSLAAVPVEFVVWHTGDSYNTIRQRLGEVLTLLQVAFTVITRRATEPAATQETT